MVIPLLVAGPLCELLIVTPDALHSTVLSSDYIDQSSRFEIDEGFGCTNAADDSILGLLIFDSWSIILPLISIIFYYRESSETMKLSINPTNIYTFSESCADFLFTRQGYQPLLAK